MSTPAPTSRKETRSPAVGGTTSHGRGGAGNISSAANVPVEANELSTPTIKTATYTTGRGGQGNMATNDPLKPAVARAAQDVDAPPHHERPPIGNYHWGRGGEGNQMFVGSETKAKEGESSNVVVEEKKAAAVGTGTAAKEGGRPSGGALLSEQPRRGSFKGAVQKGKEILGLGGKKGSEKTPSEGEVAVED